MTMLTKQQAFDRVIRALFAQGERSIGRKGCAYRGDRGLRCAAGWLIDDEAYDPCIEGKAVDGDIVWPALLKSGVPDSARRVVGALQSAHDCADLDQWPAEARDIAAHHGLGVAIVDEMESVLRAKLARAPA